MASERQDIQALLELMERLRDPQSGCPWDLEQDFDSLIPYTLEEAYEVADAIQRRQFKELQGELGDLLFQVVFYAQLAREAGLFDFGQVVEGIVDKMTRRHPHVFGADVVHNAEEQSRAWEALKDEERAAGQPERASVLDGVAMALPALTRAAKLQRRAARHGFDWPDIGPVWDKINEEIQELRQEVQASDRERQEDELGDLLFSCVNLARHLELDPEQALRRASQKFQNRLQAVEAALHEQGQSLKDTESTQLEGLWEQIKFKERD